MQNHPTSPTTNTSSNNQFSGAKTETSNGSGYVYTGEAPSQCRFHTTWMPRCTKPDVTTDLAHVQIREIIARAQCKARGHMAVGAPAPANRTMGGGVVWSANGPIRGRVERDASTADTCVLKTYWLLLSKVVYVYWKKIRWWGSVGFCFGNRAIGNVSF